MTTYIYACGGECEGARLAKDNSFATIARTVLAVCNIEGIVSCGQLLKSGITMVWVTDPLETVLAIPTCSADRNRSCSFAMT